MKHYNIPVFIPHLGCPFDCIFCDQHRIACQDITTSSEVVEILETHLTTIPAGAEVEVAFFGGSFTAIDLSLQQDYLKAVSPYLASGRVNSIRLSTRPDYIDNYILGFLNSWGVRTIELGVQSLNDEVLKAVHRGYKADDVFKACHLIKNHGFNLGVQLMIGLPGDNYQRDIETTADTIRLKPDMVRIYPTLVINGTALADLYKKGDYQPLELAEAVSITKDMFIQFERHNVNVIRMGLQPSEELRSPGTVLAGPFHPSFGELVEQEVFKEQAQKVITDYFNYYEKKPSLKIFVNNHDLSKMIGNKRCNLNWLQQSLNLNQLKIVGSEIEKGAVGVSSSGDQPKLILSRRDFCQQY